MKNTGCLVGRLISLAHVLTLRVRCIVFFLVCVFLGGGWGLLYTYMDFVICTGRVSYYYFLCYQSI